LYFYKESKENKSHTGTIMRYFLILFCFFLIVPHSNADSFDQGKDSFLNNKPAEASVFFEKAMIENPGNEDVLMYLGLSYIQNGETDKAISVFLKGAELKGNQKGRFYLNAGNAYYSRNQFDEALDLYNLIIEENLSEKGDALLNRANIHMNKSELGDAVSVYKEYLVEKPLSVQKDKILRLISLIEKKINDEALEAERLAAEAERKRLAEEKTLADAAADAERQRLAEERRKAEEAARQQALMDEILSSLSKIGDDTQNIAADSETIIHTDEVSDIDD
jgi:tetratricopeptide (TPR) repeat protein